MIGRNRADEVAGLLVALLCLSVLLWMLFHGREVSRPETISLAAGTAGGISSYELLRVYRMRVEWASELGAGHPSRALYHLAVFLGPLGGLPLLFFQRVMLGFSPDVATASSACYFLSAGTSILVLNLVGTLLGRKEGQNKDGKSQTRNSCTGDATAVKRLVFECRGERNMLRKNWKVIFVFLPIGVVGTTINYYDYGDLLPAAGILLLVLVFPCAFFLFVFWRMDRIADRSRIEVTHDGELRSVIGDVINEILLESVRALYREVDEMFQTTHIGVKRADGREDEVVFPALIAEDVWRELASTAEPFMARRSSP